MPTTTIRDFFRSAAALLLAAAPVVVFYYVTSTLASRDDEADNVAAADTRAEVAASRLDRRFDTLSDQATALAHHPRIIDFVRAALNPNPDAPSAERARIDPMLADYAIQFAEGAVVRVVTSGGKILASSDLRESTRSQVPEMSPSSDLSSFDRAGVHSRAGTPPNEFFDLSGAISTEVGGPLRAELLVRVPARHIDEIAAEAVASQGRTGRVLGIDTKGKCVLDSREKLRGVSFAAPSPADLAEWRESAALGPRTGWLLRQLPAASPVPSLLRRADASQVYVGYARVPIAQMDVVYLSEPSASWAATPASAKLAWILSALVGFSAFGYTWMQRRREFDGRPPSLVGPIVGGLVVLLVSAGATIYASRSVLDRGREIVRFFGARLDTTLRSDLVRYVAARRAFIAGVDDALAASADPGAEFRVQAQLAQTAFGLGQLTLWLAQGEAPETRICFAKVYSDSVRGRAVLPKGHSTLALPDVYMDRPEGRAEPLLVIDAPFSGPQGHGRIVWETEISTICRETMSESRTSGFEAFLLDRNEPNRALYPAGAAPDPNAILGSSFTFPPGNGLDVRLALNPTVDLFGTFTSRTVILVVGLLLSFGSSVGTTLLLASLANYRRASRVDALTGLRNRLEFTDMLDRERQRALRYNRPLSVALVDLDHFKRVNDTLGHAVGDDVLRAVSRALEAAVRSSDFVFRHGGEEFAILLPETEIEDAMLVLSRVRDRFMKGPLEAVPNAGTITVSAGVAMLLPDESADGVLARADFALYASKREGRNRVTPADGTARSGSPDEPVAVHA